MAYRGTPAREFVDLEIVQQHLQAATQFVALDAAQSYRQGVDGAMRHVSSVQFDSPLEALFWLWWSACAMGPRIDDILVLSPQHEIVLAGGERFRVDFLIEPIEQRLASQSGWTPLAVEVDGHGFHERTLEQVAYRDRRDRALQQDGWKVFHFSFSEFTTRPVECVSEVMVFARNQYNRVSLADYQERSHRAG